MLVCLDFLLLFGGGDADAVGGSRGGRRELYDQDDPDKKKKGNQDSRYLPFVSHNTPFPPIPHQTNLTTSIPTQAPASSPSQ